MTLSLDQVDFIYILHSISDQDTPVTVSLQYSPGPLLLPIGDFDKGGSPHLIWVLHVVAMAG